MWERVSLRNYRSIEQADVVLAPFTVLVGANGSGKSNFADALLLMAEIPFDAEAAIKRRGGITSVRRRGAPESAVTSVAIRDADSREDLEFKFVEQSFSLLPDADEGWRFGAEKMVIKDGRETDCAYVRGDAKSLLDPLELDPKLPVRHFDDAGVGPRVSLSFLTRLMKPRSYIYYYSRRIQLDLVQMRAPQLSGPDVTLEDDGRNLAGVLGHLKTERSAVFESVLLAMRRLVPELVDFSVTKAGQYSVLEFIQHHSNGDTRFGIQEMSDGALRALGIIVAARTRPHGRSLIIEEPEVSIHPAAAAVLYEVLKDASTRGSILVTTHSPEFLDAARDEEILVCRYRNGLTRVGPLATSQREVLNEGLFRLSELIRSEPLRIEGEPPDVLGSSGTEP